jgi:hypothetical protein
MRTALNLSVFHHLFYSGRNTRSGQALLATLQYILCREGNLSESGTFVKQAGSLNVRMSLYQYSVYTKGNSDRFLFLDWLSYPLCFNPTFEGRN